MTVSPSGPCLHSTLNERRLRSRASCRTASCSDQAAAGMGMRGSMNLNGRAVKRQRRLAPDGPVLMGAAAPNQVPQNVSCTRWSGAGASVSEATSGWSS